MDWYATPAVPPAVVDTPIGNAWALFETLDLVLAICGAGALYIAYEQITGRLRLGEKWLLPIGLLALLVVASQLIDPPPNLASVPDPAIKTGAWLALAGTAAMSLAGIMSVARVSMAVVLDDSSSGGSRSTTSRRRAATAED